MRDHPAMQVTPTHGLRVRLYGDAAVLLPDGLSVALERRAAALLALAALEPGITRMRAATLLWPDSSDPRRNLRQQLLRFRTLFGQSLVEGDTTLTCTGLELEAPDEAAPPSAQLLNGLDYEDCEHFAEWLQAQRHARHDRRVKSLGEALSQAEAEQRYGDAIELALTEVIGVEVLRVQVDGAVVDRLEVPTLLQHVVEDVALLAAGTG